MKTRVLGGYIEMQKKNKIIFILEYSPVRTFNLYKRLRM